MKKSIWGLSLIFLVACQPAKDSQHKKNEQDNKSQITSTHENKDEKPTITETCRDEYLIAAQLLDQRNLNCGKIGRDEEVESTEGDVTDDDVAENVGRDTFEQVAANGTELDNSIDELKQDSRTCDRMKKLNFPILIAGNAVTINTAFAYRVGTKTWEFLPIGDLPNRFKRTSDLIFQAKNILDGKDLKRTARKVNKKLKIKKTTEEIANAIIKLDESGALCKNNEFFTVTRVREILIKDFNSQN
jgi:hypothetical protein